MMKHFYQVLVKVGTAFQPFLLLLLRLVWGIAFILAGWGKVFIVPKIGEFFGAAHIPYPVLNAYFVSYMELIGGLCLLIGFASRLVAIPLSIIMVVALLVAHAKDIVDFSSLLNQPPISFLIACLVIFAFGPGRFSVDYWLQKSK